MKVLIGITTRNRQHILPKAIESALRQNYVPKEIAVIDDASDKDQGSLARRYSDVRWIFNSTPCGYRRNRNRLMQETDAEFFVSLDDDAWFMGQDEIEIAVREIQQRPEAAASERVVGMRDRADRHSTSALPQ